MTKLNNLRCAVITAPGLSAVDRQIDELGATITDAYVRDAQHSPFQVRDRTVGVLSER